MENTSTCNYNESYLQQKNTDVVTTPTTFDLKPTEPKFFFLIFQVPLKLEWTALAYENVKKICMQWKKLVMRELSRQSSSRYQLKRKKKILWIFLKIFQVLNLEWTTCNYNENCLQHKPNPLLNLNFREIEHVSQLHSQLHNQQVIQLILSN